MKKNRISQQAKPANQGVGFGIRKQIQPSAAFHEYENITGDANPKIKKIDEVDPLDEYMSVIETQLQNEQKEVQGNPNNTEKAKQKGVEEGEDEEEDMVDTYIRAMDEKGYKFGTYKEDASEIKTWIQDKEVLEVPEEIQQFSNKNIEPMKKVDHSKIQYRNIKKFEYSEHNEVKSFELRNIRKELGISVSENDKTKPCLKFEHFGFPENLNKIIEKYDFKDPTDIQKQAIPIIFSGKDVIGIAKTGSGKTASFVWPMLIHVKNQIEVQTGVYSGPISVILSPTRELSIQIYNETRRYSKTMGISVAVVFGGVSKHEQLRYIQTSKPQVLIATPGRFIDVLESDNCSITLENISFLVIDEADRMLNLGFERQVVSICDNIRPDRQTLLFSATFPKKIDIFAKNVTRTPTKINVGLLGEMNSDILQSFVIFESSEDKWSWLSKNIVKFIMEKSLLIFTCKKDSAEMLAHQLSKSGFECKFLHGDMLQTERDSTVHAFKTLKVPILVATDVASRGLDIKSVKTVINYEVARDVESHIHRVGRTGRAGEKGEAYTLFSVSEPGDVRFASKLTKHLNSVGLRHLVTSDLLQLAQKDPRFEDERSFSRYSMGHPKILAPLLEKSRLPTDKSGLGGKQMGASPTIFDKTRATLISNPVSTSTSTPTFSSSFIGFTKASSQAGGASGLSSIDLPNEKLSCNTPVKKKSRWG